MNLMLASPPILEGLLQGFMDFTSLQITSLLKPISDLRATNLHALLPRLSIKE